MARVVACDDGAAQRVAGALHKSATAERVVASVFMRDGGNDELDPVIFAGLVHAGMPEITPIARRTLMKLRSGWWPSNRLQLPRESRSTNNRNCRAWRHELFFDGLRRQFIVGADSAEVGKDAEDALGLLTFV